MHLSKEDIGGIFHDKLGIPETYEPQVLAEAARVRLRERFRSAERRPVGRKNFGIAETG